MVVAVVQTLDGVEVLLVLVLFEDVVLGSPNANGEFSGELVDVVLLVEVVELGLEGGLVGWVRKYVSNYLEATIRDLLSVFYKFGYISNICLNLLVVFEVRILKLRKRFAVLLIRLEL